MHLFYDHSIISNGGEIRQVSHTVDVYDTDRYTLHTTAAYHFGNDFPLKNDDFTVLFRITAPLAACSF